MVPFRNAKATFVVLVIAACSVRFAAGGQKTACGAVSADGRFAGALVGGEDLELEILSSDGTRQETHLALDLPSDLCRLSFDRQGRYLALGLQMSDKGERRLRIAVFDTHVGRWAESFFVNPEPDMPFPERFEGFLGETSNLVVTGFAHGSYHSPEKSAVRVAVFSVDGHLLGPVLTREIPGSYFNWDVDFTDASHNRLWFNHTPHSCPLGSATLTGPLITGPTVEERVLGGLACDLQNAIGFPDDMTLLGASTRSGRSWVWRVDLSNGEGEKLELPEERPGFFVKWNQYEFSNDLQVSPDGQICAIFRGLVSSNVLDQAEFKSGSVLIVKVRPLGMVNILKPSKSYDLVGFAVDQKDGQLTALNHRRGGKWELVLVLRAGRK